MMKLPPGFQLVDDETAAPAAAGAPQLPPGFELVEEPAGDPASAAHRIGRAAQGAATGALESAIGLAELPQTAFQGALRVGAKGAEAIRGFVGMPFSDEQKAALEQITSTSLPKPATEARKAAGIEFEPQNTEEAYAHTLGGFATNAVGGPASLGGKAAMILLPGLASETAGQALKGKTGETAARVAAAVLAGGGTAAGAKALQGPAVTGMTRRGAEYALDSVSSPAARAKIEEQLAKLGPEATLADVSPEWFAVARAAAARPGGRDKIVNVLEGRDAGRNARLNASADGNLGPAPIPSFVERELKASRKALNPAYDEALDGASAVDTSDLAARLEAAAVTERGAAQAEAQATRKMLDVTDAPGTLDPDPRTLLKTRRAIDGRLYDRNVTDDNVKAVLGEARRGVDDELTAAVPGIKEIDGKVAELHRQSEGLEAGQKVFATGRDQVKRPAELVEDVTAAVQPQGTLVGPSGAAHRMRQGARAEIDRAIGTNANDPAAVQRLVKGEGDWNRAHMGTLFGSDKAGRFLNDLDAERVFAKTGYRVAQGSDTAATTRFAKFLDDLEEPTAVPLETSATGLTLRALQKTIGLGSKAKGEREASRVSDELGALSVAQGADRDAAVQRLVEALEARGVSAPHAKVMASAMAARAAEQGAQR